MTMKIILVKCEYCYVLIQVVNKWLFILILMQKVTNDELMIAYEKTDGGAPSDIEP